MKMGAHKASITAHCKERFLIGSCTQLRMNSGATKILADAKGTTHGRCGLTVHCTVQQPVWNGGSEHLCYRGAWDGTQVSYKLCAMED